MIEASVPPPPPPPKKKIEKSLPPPPPPNLKNVLFQNGFIENTKPRAQIWNH